jgi:hypothetical protein
MTVIIVRGGRGSGKSFLIRKVLACAVQNEPYTEHIDATLLPQPRPGRDGKVFTLGHILDAGWVFVVGCYDDGNWPSGPDRYQRQIKHCDSLLFNLLLTKAKEHQHVLFEYIASSLSDWRFPSSVRSRFVILAHQCDLRIIQLTTSVEECVASYNARREEIARAKGKAFRPDRINSADDYRKSLDSAQRLAASGLSVAFLDRKAALQRVLKLIRS